MIRAAWLQGWLRIQDSQVIRSAAGGQLCCGAWVLETSQRALHERKTRTKIRYQRQLLKGVWHWERNGSKAQHLACRATTCCSAGLLTAHRALARIRRFRLFLDSAPHLGISAYQGRPLAQSALGQHEICNSAADVGLHTRVFSTMCQVCFSVFHSMQQHTAALQGCSCSEQTDASC